MQPTHLRPRKVDETQILNIIESTHIIYQNDGLDVIVLKIHDLRSFEVTKSESLEF